MNKRGLFRLILLFVIFALVIGGGTLYMQIKNLIFNDGGDEMERINSNVEEINLELGQDNEKQSWIESFLEF